MRKRRTITGLILGVLAGVGLIMVPGLLAQTPSNSGSSSYLGQAGPLAPAGYQKQLPLYSLAASSVGIILATTFLIFLAAVAVSLLMRSLAIKRIGGALPASEKESETEVLDPS